MACSSALFGVPYFLFRIVPSCFSKPEVKNSQVDDQETQKLKTTE